MKRYFGLSLFAFLSVTLCRGALGDAEAQCIARYGNAFASRDNLGFDVVGDKSASFTLKTSQGNFTLNVIFFNGVAAHEAITNADASQGISFDQTQSLLALEGPGFPWKKTGTTYRTDRSDNTTALQTWVRSDDATASCWMFGKAKVQSIGEIDLSTREYNSAQEALDKQGGASEPYFAPFAFAAFFRCGVH